jgi:TolA-binding protein
MKHANKFELIESFYRKTIKRNDKKEFNQIMSEDASFKKEVKGYKQIFNGLESLHIEHFENKISNFESQYKDNVLPLHNNNRRPLRKIYYAAAAIALLICATFGYNIMAPTEFDQHFHASQSIAVHMGSVRNGDNVLSTPEQIKKSAFSAYQQEKYEKSINLIKDYLNTYPKIASKDYQSILVLGVAQLVCDQPDKASKNLELVINSNDSSYKQEAQWMWVMAQYKLNNKSATKAVLEKITQQKGHIHKKAATKLLNNM